MALRTITLRGFKSIASLENFEMRNINLLIGANGSGKSNFLSAFKFLAKIAQGNLQSYVLKEGGADVFLYGSRKRTSRLEFEVVFKGKDDDLIMDNEYDAGYRFSLDVSSRDRLFFFNEEIYPVNGLFGRWHPLGQAHEEARLLKARSVEVENVVRSLSSFRQYHFHDTGSDARVKQKHRIIDNIRLKETADNLASYLNFIRINYNNTYKKISETIRMMVPFFGDFIRDLWDAQFHRSGAGPEIPHLHNLPQPPACCCFTASHSHVLNRSGTAVSFTINTVHSLSAAENRRLWHIHQCTNIICDYAR